MQSVDAIEPVRQWVRKYAANTGESTADAAAFTDEEDELAGVEAAARATPRALPAATAAGASQLRHNPVDCAFFLDFAVHQADPTSTVSDWMLLSPKIQVIILCMISALLPHQ